MSPSPAGRFYGRRCIFDCDEEPSRLPRRKGFAYVWRPGQYVASDVPAVLSIALPYEAKSDRFKEVVHPSANVWMHHIELHDASQIDDEVRGWLVEAYTGAG